MTMHVLPLPKDKPSKLGFINLQLSRVFLFRVLLVAVFVGMTHQFRWDSLRFVTSEAILRLSALLGMATARTSFDTIRVQHAAFSFVVACTFVDVFMGSVPLIWDIHRSFLGNSSRLIAAAAILFIFNVVRLEIGQILYAHRMSWTFADQVLGGISYFLVWLVIWRLRNWQIFIRYPVTTI